MKKIIFASLLLTGLSAVFTGCLKDKGFENNEYGINDPDTQPPGVGFPFGSKAKSDFGLDVSASAQSVAGLVYVNLESGTPAKSAVAVTLTNNSTALIAAYNTANNLTGTSAVLAMPTALYTVPLALTIPAGGRNVQTSISVSNTTGLDANRAYAIGLTITAVDGGYKIADNLKNLFIVFSVKNAYDGKYTLRGKFHHPTGANPPANFTTTVEMQTTGPSTVKMYWPLAGLFASPISFGGSLNSFGTQEPEFAVNTATNAVLVTNSNAAGVVYAMSATGFGALPYNHRWDPATKTFFASWGYNLGAGGAFGGNGSASRMWEDTLIRTGPR
jgi:Domain of unknown function (DUF1735)